MAIWHSSLPPFWSTDRLLENCFPPGQNVGQWLGNLLFMRTGDTPTTTHNTDLSASVRIELDMDHLFGSRRPLATIAPIDLIFANRFHINHIPLAWFMHELRSQVTLCLFCGVSCCPFLIVLSFFFRVFFLRDFGVEVVFSRPLERNSTEVLQVACANLRYYVLSKL